MTKILVTGSAGLIGRQIVRDLVEEKYDVYSSYHKTKPEFGISIYLDLANENEITEIFNKIKPDIVIHLAAVTDVELCEINKEETSLINTTSTKILVRESVKHNSFFVYMSTDYVFDGTDGFRNEDDIPNPINFYGKSKFHGEIEVKKLATRYAIIRTSTPFGLHPIKKTFPLWVKENLESKKNIPVLIDQFTSPTYVPNLSKMIIEVATKQIMGIIHLAGSTRISRYEFAQMIAEKLHLDETLIIPITIKEMKWNAIRPVDSSLDISRANGILNHKPEKIQNSLDLLINQLNN